MLQADDCGTDYNDTLTDAAPIGKWPFIFDEQYREGMGFKNEKNWMEKYDGKTVF